LIVHILLRRVHACIQLKIIIIIKVH